MSHQIDYLAVTHINWRCRNTFFAKLNITIKHNISGNKRIILKTNELTQDLVNCLSSMQIDT